MAAKLEQDSNLARLDSSAAKNRCYCSSLEQADAALDRRDQLRGIVRDALLEHERRLAHVLDARRRIAVDHDEIRLLSRDERPRERASAQIGRAVQGGDLDRLERREACFDEQLERALIRVAGDHAAAAGGVGAGEERAAGAN